jgi:hypothetical protein
MPNAAPFSLRQLTPPAIADAIAAAAVDVDTARAIVTLPLPVIALLTPRGAVDAFGAFIAYSIRAAVARQYPAPVNVDNVGAFGGASAFARLPHRSVTDNARRYGVAPAPVPFICNHCNGRAVDICHGVPRSMAGALTAYNLRLDCAACNRLTRDIVTPAAIAALYAYTVTIDIGAAALRDYTDAAR